MRDLTERKRVEERFRQLERIQAMGRLAGGIAHDFNNLLTVINGYSELVQARLPIESTMRSDLDQVSRAGGRAALLTEQLLAFSRQQVRRTKVLDPNAVIVELDSMLRRVIGEDVELITLLAEDVRWVEADPGQLEQIILNLALNARDAMPRGGRLQIETRNFELTDDFASERPGAHTGPHVRIRVTDDGTGMDAETCERVFEPFFTTKGEGKGTGLGLSTVYGIVQQNGGYIELESVPGEGTTFCVYLPSRDGRPGALELQRELATPNPRGSETILVVEDEASVRRYLVQILGDLGYDVVEASYGDEALERFEMHDGSPIRLLVTDVVMPRMGGRELAERLRERAPELKLLFISGYTGSDGVFLDRLGPEAAFLQKPFLPRAVAQSVRQLLDA